MTTIDISSRRVIQTFVIAVSTIAICFSIGQFSKHVLGHGWLKGFVPQFDLNLEANIPTWYSSIALFVAFLLLWMIGSAVRTRGNHLFHWRLLALTFLLLSVDEAAALHEMTTVPLRDALHVSGLLHHTWIILGIVFVVLFGIIFIPFLRSLPRRTMLLFGGAGAIFVAGAIGVESLGGNYLGYIVDASPESWRVTERPVNLVYSGLYLVEELMEMLGIVLFIYALLDYMKRELGGVTIRFGDTSE